MIAKIKHYLSLIKLHYLSVSVNDSLELLTYLFLIQSEWNLYINTLLQCNTIMLAHHKTRNTGKQNYGTRNTGGTPEHWQNIQPNTDRTIGIPRNSGT